MVETQFCRILLIVRLSLSYDSLLECRVPFFLSRQMRDELRDDSRMVACLASAATKEAVFVAAVLVFLQGFLCFGDTLSTTVML